MNRAIHVVLCLLCLTCMPGEIPAGTAFAAARPVQLAVAGLEQRFIATGIVRALFPAEKGVHKAVIRIEAVAPAAGYPGAGEQYLGKEIEVLSETAFPGEMNVDARITIVLRIVGDEWRQYLFFVEVVKDGQEQTN